MSGNGFNSIERKPSVSLSIKSKSKNALRNKTDMRWQIWDANMR